ncbi:TetR/AcrR family transcriptional regulator [Streptomyces botrytidirepellens]|uniref:TetR/AcrR family transcriptional regulator n=1 Tax=Streptomyces botrytidirepellens TaxID=2486417 RepID=A0A3M8SKQ8_9ACTN|nr:TetR/AcrR family transcriptional regulator [Streptomyces botrytidirepellens]RNF81255.1 TetR/AcrR family transcriptional regulator [Streptomyces botrytidirepellens]
MARPRMFDEERALDAAMRAFWANGYEATSTQDLCAATGLGRSSIYNTFHSKHDLFQRALARYIDIKTTAQIDLLEDEERPVVERIRAFLATIIDSEFEERAHGHSLGCLTVNTTVELAGRDPEIAAMLERDLERRLAALGVALRGGQRDGHIASARDAESLARFVNAVTGGMRVAARGGAGRAELESIASTAMDVLMP